MAKKDAFLQFLKAARSLADQGLSKEAIVQFAKNEFGELSELFKKQIDNLFKPGKGIENIKIKDEVFDDTVVKLPIDDTGQPFNPNNPLKEYGKPKKAGKGQFTKAEYLIQRLKNTIKENPDDKYVQENFPNFVKEIEANPDLAKNENVFRELGGDLPSNQKITVYDDDTLDFARLKPTKKFQLNKERFQKDFNVADDVVERIIKLSSEDQQKELQKYINKDFKERIELSDYDVTDLEPNAEGGRAGYKDGLRAIDKGFFITPPDPYEGLSSEEKEMRKALDKIMSEKFQKKLSPEDVEKIKIQQEIRKRQAEEMRLPEGLQLMNQGGRAGYYTGGITDVEPSLDDIGHGSDALMARTRLMSPGAQATTSTGLNYLLAEDNDNMRVPFGNGKNFEMYLREREQIERQQRLEQLIKEYQDDMNRKKVMEQKQEAAEGGRIGFANGNGVADEDAEKAALGKRVRELMDEGFDMGEAVRKAMSEGYAEGGRIGFSKGKAVTEGLSYLMDLFKPKPKVIFDEKRFREGPVTTEFLEKINKKDLEPFIRSRDTMGPGSYGMYDDFADMPSGLQAAELISRIKGPRNTINYEAAEMFIGKKLKGNESVNELIEMLVEKKAEGGRIGFSKGKIAKEVADKGRRGFMKAAGAAGAGIAALKTGLLGFGKEAAPVAKEVIETVSETAKGVPPYFYQLIDVIKSKGQKIKSYGDRIKQYVAPSKDGKSELMLTEDLNTGDIQVKKIYKEGDDIVTKT
jgi:hypothetical protein